MNNSIEELVEELMIEKAKTKELEDYSNKISNSIIEVLNKYISKIKESKSLFMGSILSDMICEIKEIYPLCDISGEEILVKDIIKNIIKYDDRFKDYFIDDDRLEWILREFHDSYFDYDGFEKGVVKAMEYVKENYEKY